MTLNRPLHSQGPAWGYNNTCPRSPNGECIVEGHCTTIGPYSDHEYGGYEDAMLAREVLRTVAAHDLRFPYFLFW